MEKISFWGGKGQENKKDMREPRTVKSVFFFLFLMSYISLFQMLCEVIERGKKDAFVEEMIEFI